MPTYDTSTLKQMVIEGDWKCSQCKQIRPFNIYGDPITEKCAPCFYENVDIRDTQKSFRVYFCKCEEGYGNLDEDGICYECREEHSDEEIFDGFFINGDAYYEYDDIICIGNGVFINGDNYKDMIEYYYQDSDIILD